MTTDRIAAIREALDRGGFHATARGHFEDGVFIIEALTHLDALEKEREELRAAVALIIKRSHSHVDGRFLFDELKGRKTLDIKKRKDGVETWYEGDWLTDLGIAIEHAATIAGASKSTTNRPRRARSEDGR